MVLNLWLLGSPYIGHTGAQAVPCSRQALDFLAFLVTRPDRRVTREQIGLAFWADSSEERVRGRVSTALWRVRTVLRTLGVSPEEVVWADGERITICQTAPMWIDADGLRAACRAAHAAPPGPLASPTIELLEKASQLYRGEFLAGHTQDWCLVERQSLRTAYQNVLERLLEHHVAAGNWHGAVATGELLLHDDPLLEHVHRDLIRAYAGLGQRTRAVQQFERCQQLLADELGVEPMSETADACREAMRSVASPHPRAGASPPAVTTIEATIADLRQIATRLERLKDQLGFED